MSETASSSRTASVGREAATAVPRPGALAGLIVLALVLGMSSRVARAHETDHFTPPPRRAFAELGPAFTRDFHARMVRAVAVTNARIERAPSLAAQEALRTPAHIARAVCAQFGVAGFYIDEVERFVHSEELEAEYPGLITGHWAKPCVYDEALLPVDPRQFYLLWRGSVFVINGEYVSSDKIGHFVHHGYNYYAAYQRARSAGRDEAEARFQAVLQVGVGDHFFFSEWRLLGTLTSGVVSNADLAANYIGMLFYINLTEEVRLQGRAQPPMLRLEGGFWRFNPHVRPDSDFLVRFFSPHFDEALNPNWYDALTARVMREVVGRRCASLRLMYVDENGTPRPESYFEGMREALRSYYGEPYGHTGIYEQNLVSILDVCFCDGTPEGPAAGEAGIAAVAQGERVPAGLRGMTALHEAARAGDAEVAEELLAAGAEASVRTVRGVTALHLVATEGVVGALLRAGAAVDGRDALERTPLHWAVRAGRVAVAAALLDAGADVDARDCDGETALHMAAREGNAEVVTLLLRAGGARSPVALYDTTPLHLAARRGHGDVVELLVAAGAPADVADAFGCTPLHEAVAGGHVAVTAALMAAGADPGVRDACGNSPLQAAARAGSAELLGVVLRSGALGKHAAEEREEERARGARRRSSASPAADSEGGRVR